jgi:hypothetical protein
MQGVPCPSSIRLRWLAALALVAGCGKSAARDQAQEAPPPPTPWVGVDPKDFTCASIAPTADLEAVLGTPLRAVESSMPSPKGVAAPCNYLVEAGTAPEAWTFDFDCRPGALLSADKLFDQYSRTSQDLVDQYAAEMDAGYKPPPDAGPARAPEAAHEVEVGKRALDHHGQGLLFVDDDAPCYVRIVGPDPARRLALAKLIADHLHEANAPMIPHRQAPKE